MKRFSLQSETKANMRKVYVLVLVACLLCSVLSATVTYAFVNGNSHQTGLLDVQISPEEEVKLAVGEHAASTLQPFQAIVG